MNQRRMSAQAPILLGVALFLGSASALHAQQPKPRATLKHGDRPIICLLFTPDGGTLVSQSAGEIAGDGGELEIWDMTTKKSIAKQTGLFGLIALSPDGKTLASGDVNTRFIRLWDLASGKASNLGDPKYGDNGALSMAFSPDGKLLASGALVDETVLVWDLAESKLSAALTGDAAARVGALAFSPDGKVLASGNYNDKIDLWDVSTGKSIATLKGHTAGVSYVAISADGKTLVSGGRDDTVKLWNIATGKNTATLTGISCKPALSADGKMLATNGQGGIQLWDMPATKDGK